MMQAGTLLPESLRVGLAKRNTSRDHSSERVGSLNETDVP